VGVVGYFRDLFFMFYLHQIQWVALTCVVWRARPRRSSVGVAEEVAEEWCRLVVVEYVARHAMPNLDDIEHSGLPPKILAMCQ
jgi:hypothetical protein